MRSTTRLRSEGACREPESITRPARAGLQIVFWVPVGLFLISSELGDLPRSTAFVGAVAVGLGLYDASRSIAGRRPRLATLVGAIAAALLLVGRAMLGRLDLANVPPQFGQEQVSLSDYESTVLVSTVGLLAFILGGRIGRMFEIRSENAYRYVLESPNHHLLVLFGVSIAGRFILLSLYGIGEKGSVGLSATWMAPMSLVLAATIDICLVYGLWNLVQSNGTIVYRYLYIAAIAANAGTSYLAGNRGTLLNLLLSIVVVFLFQRPSEAARFSKWKLMTGFVVAGIATTPFLSQRAQLTGGRDFDTLEFLLYRVSGANRFAPVVGADLRVGFTSALTNTNFYVNGGVYGLPDTAQTAEGLPLLAVGYLAAGVLGVAATGVVIGLVAGLMDSWYLSARQTTLVSVLYVTMCLLLFHSMLEARPQFRVAQLVGYVSASLLVLGVFAMSQGRPLVGASTMTDRLRLRS